ncbi:SNF2 family N-terminal domain-containing protein, partial [Lasiosphaeria ovina]
MDPSRRKKRRLEDEWEQQAQASQAPKSYPTASRITPQNSYSHSSQWPATESDVNMVDTNQAPNFLGQGFAESCASKTPPNSKAPTAGDTLVCYGMVTGFHGKYIRTANDAHQGSNEFPVAIQSSSKFTALFSPESSGALGSEFVDVFEELLGQASLRLQAFCAASDVHSQPTGQSRLRFGPVAVPCSLSIIVYGPWDLCEDVGEFFQDLDMYLQDPRGCDMDVKYCNPHRLSSLDIDNCPMTSDPSLTGLTLDQDLFENITRDNDVLGILDAHQDLPEAPQPEAILPSLKRHQKQALSFLLEREKGWNFDTRSSDFWDLMQTSQATCFVNKISNSAHRDEPPEFCGGIVADPMGLGKTLTMIALVATDRSGAFHNPGSGLPSPVRMPSLILVPPPLLDTWEEQLSQHVRRGGITWRRHYGKEKLTEADDLSPYDIVISTYHTVTGDWGGGHKAPNSVLFSTCWKRIILDEAHVIRNTQSQMARAVCALDGTSRWAVTGTPIQNRIGDLSALLKFIRAHPYDDARQFELDIGQMWKTGDIEEAAKRLKNLSSSLILRRPKTVIDLPPRVDLKFPVEFNAVERELYEKLKHQIIARADEAFSDGEPGAASNSYITVMQRINALRMVCDLGLHYDTRHDLAVSGDKSSGDVGDWSRVAQQAFNLQREMDLVACGNCRASCDTTTALLDCESSPVQPVFAQCLAFLCSDCVQRCARRNKPLTCGHGTAHPFAPVSVSWTALEESRDMASGDGALGGAASSLAQFGLSSKVKALVSQLAHLPSGEKSVVFSSWRMTLDLVQAGLKQQNIKFVRFDGKVQQKNRQSIIDRFRKDATVQVFLLTLSCGAVGWVLLHRLTLTEACRAYLVEPHWNPAVEEQALARIYRLGQQREVTTVRFFVRDTFEERVLDLQESKRKLEEVLLEKKGRGAQEGFDHLE